MPATTTTTTYNNSLSDDVLYRIFELVVKTDTNTNEQEDASRSPWNLAAVSPDWRCICLNSPLLWTTISFRDHSCPCANTGDDLEEDSDPVHDVQAPCSPLGNLRCQLRLERSMGLPLDVRLSHHHSLSRSSCARSITETALAERRRWKTLALSGDAESLGLLETLLEPLATEAWQQLEELTYECDGEHGSFTLPSAFESSLLPRLRSVSLSFWKGRWSQTQQFPWHQLQHVTVRSHAGSMSALLRLLGQCTQVQKFQVSVLCFDDPPHSIARVAPEDIQLESLTHFDIGMNFLAAPLWQHIRAANVDSLVLTIGRRAIHDSFLELLTESAGNIRKLEINLHSAETDPSFLTYFTQLEVLILRGRPVRDYIDCSPLLAKLLPSNVEGSAPRSRLARMGKLPLSNLAHLTIQDLSFDAETLTQILRLRSRVGSRESRGLLVELHSTKDEKTLVKLYTAVPEASRSPSCHYPRTREDRSYSRVRGRRAGVDDEGSREYRDATCSRSRSQRWFE